MLSLDAIASASLVVLLATMDSDESGKVVAKRFVQMPEEGNGVVGRGDSSALNNQAKW